MTPGLGNFGAAAALHALRVGWPTQVATRALLEEVALANQPDGSDAAVRELSAGWPNDPETFKVLVKVMFSGKFGWETAVHELCQGWPESPEAWHCLMNIPKRTGVFGVNAIVRELSVGWPADPSIRAFVKQHLQLIAQNGMHVAEITELLAIDLATEAVPL